MPSLKWQWFHGDPSYGSSGTHTCAAGDVGHCSSLEGAVMRPALSQYLRQGVEGVEKARARLWWLAAGKWGTGKLVLSSGCCNKASQTGEGGMLKATEMYCLTDLHEGWALSEMCKASILASCNFWWLPQSLPSLGLELHNSSLCPCRHMASCPPVPVCLHLMRPPAILVRDHTASIWPHLTLPNYICNDLASK